MNLLDFSCVFPTQMSHQFQEGEACMSGNCTTVITVKVQDETEKLNVADVPLV